MLEQLPYLALKTPPKTTALLKAECADFIVKEHLGYEMSGDGEFVALYVRKTDCNTLFVGEKLAKFAGVSERNMGYAGLKDRRAVTEQWFCLQMPGMETPDFSQFELDGVEILTVTRHNRKIRTGSLEEIISIFYYAVQKNLMSLKCGWILWQILVSPIILRNNVLVGMAITSRKHCVGLKGKSR